MKDKINSAIISVLCAAAFFGVYFAAQFVASLVFAFVFGFIAAMNGITDPNAITDAVLSRTMELTIISNVIAIVGCILLLLPFRRDRDDLADRLDFRIDFQPPWQVIGFSLALGVFGQLAISLFLNLIPFPQSWIDMQMESAAVILDSPLLIQIIGVSIMAPLAEEIIFRCCIQGTLKQGIGSWAAIIVTSVVFGAMHGTPISFIYATALGILMGWLYDAFNSIIPSMAFHFAFNTLSLIIDEQTPIFLYIISVAIFVACLVFLIVLARKNKDTFYFD